MGTMSVFDILLSPIFAVMIVLMLVAAIAALIILSKRRQLTSGLKWIFGLVIVICTIYLVFMLALVFLFGQGPPREPVPTYR